MASTGLPIDIATAGNLPELAIPPDSSGFSDQPSDGIVEIQLDGGAPRQRADKIGNLDVVSVRWSVGPNGYNYLRAFYRAVALPPNGPTPFILKMPIDTSDPSEEHQCVFQANSFKLASQQGLQWVVQATLYVLPTTVDPNDDAQHIADFGS
jgi:hypothetical protein